MWDKQNAIIRRAGFVPAPQAANLLEQGGLGSWYATWQSTDATLKALAVSAPAKSSGITVTALVTATKSDGSKVASWLLRATVRANVTPTLTLVGASTIDSDADSGFTPAAELNISGANVVLNMTGLGATTINWSAKIEVA